MDLLILWLFLTVAQWSCVVSGLRDLSAESDSDRKSAARVTVLFAAVPPTLIFLISSFVLLHAAPTVQFNAGNNFAMDLWSFWVHWWQSLFNCAGVQSVCYFLWLVVSFAPKDRPRMRWVVLWGFLSSLWGWFLLNIASPRA
jgi:hypothetical protein